MPATPSMSLNETALDFGINEMGSTSAAQYVVMNTVSVNEPFTVSTTAPFEVSLDGTTFAATQTLRPTPPPWFTTPSLCVSLPRLPVPSTRT